VADAPDAIWLSQAGRDFNMHARCRRADGSPRVDTLLITGLDIDARLLREVSTARLLAIAGSYLPDAHAKGPQHLARIENKLAELLAALAEPRLHLEAPPAGEPRAPLTRPDGTDPAGFSRRVAAAYREVVGTSSTPAKLLADEAGVPVTTVHRWIREARRAGYLEPARKGRAG
jgi:hypothetical protein